MASPRSHPQHSRSMSNSRFAGMLPPLMLVNPSDLQMNGVRVDGSLLSSKTFIDSMTASFSSQHDNMSPSTPDFLDSPSSTVSADSFMPVTPQALHQGGRFMCPNTNCSYSIVGLNTATELDQHIASGSHLSAPVEFELELSGSDHVALSHSEHDHHNSMLPAPMWEQKQCDYFALPMHPVSGRKSFMHGQCACRYCIPSAEDVHTPTSMGLELAPAVGGNGFDHRTWQQNMKLEKAMQAVLREHQRVRENEAFQSIALTNNVPAYHNNSFYGAPIGGYAYGNAFAY